jgi:hypothetical protein
LKQLIAFARSLAALSFVMIVAACSGGGGGGSSPPPPPGSKLFIADGANRAVGSLVNSNPGAGSSAIDRVIQGSNTGFGGGTSGSFSLPSLAIDAAADRLYVAVQSNGTMVFDQAGLVSGNATPSRKIIAQVNRGGVLAFVNFWKLSLDKPRDVLYNADNLGELQAFHSASALNGGSLTPTRIIQVNLGGIAPNSAFGIGVDSTNDRLYVGLNSSNIVVFNGASGVNTGLATTQVPDRAFTFFGTATSFYLDAVNDRLYIAITNGDIQVFDNVSTLTGGPLTATRTMNLGGTGWFIFVETTGNRLYAVANNLVVIVQNASTSSGFVGGTILAVPGGGSQFGAVVVKP